MTKLKEKGIKKLLESTRVSMINMRLGHEVEINSHKAKNNNNNKAQFPTIQI
jgi:hypothetical protein